MANKGAGGMVETKCNGCGDSDEVMVRDLYRKGGYRCRKCGGSLAAVPQNHPDTHRSSRERHGNKPAARTEDPAKIFKRKGGR